MKRYYEIVTIFRPTISQEKMEKDVKKIKDIIKSCNGEVVNEEHWGSKKLAYEIKKFSTGIYHFIFCNVEKFTFVEEVKKFFSTNEDVIRYGIKKIEKIEKRQKSSNSEHLNENSLEEKQNVR